MLEFKQHFDKWDEEDKMEMNMFGSVSGGCVEGAVLKEAQKLFETGGGKSLAFGVTNEDAWSVGLSCGGKLGVYLQILEKDEFRTKLFEKLKANETVIWNTKLEDSLEVENILADIVSEDPAIFSHEIISANTPCKVL